MNSAIHLKKQAIRQSYLKPASPPHSFADKLLNDKKFVNIITSGTATIDNVKGRHNMIYKLFRKVLADD